MNLIGLSLHARKFPGAAARSFLIGGALACLAGVTSVQATPTLSTAVYPNDTAYYFEEAAFLGRPDVTQVDFGNLVGETWDTSDIFSTRFWSESKRLIANRSTIAFVDGVSVTGGIQLLGVGHVGQDLPFRTDLRWLPAAPLPGVPPELQLLTLSFANPIKELSLHFSDLGDAANFNLNQAINGLTFIDLHFEAFLQGTSVFSQLTFDAIADGNRQGRSLLFNAGAGSFDEVRLTYGGDFPDGDIADTVLIDNIAFTATSVPEASSLMMLLSAFGLLALLASRPRNRRNLLTEQASGSKVA